METDGQMIDDQGSNEIRNIWNHLIFDIKIKNVNHNLVMY